MTTIDVSAGKDNYSQRNNEFRGSSACNVTSGAMFISYSEKKLPFVPKDMALDDFLMATLLGKEGYEKMFELAESLYPEYTPNEVHSCLAWAINRVMGKDIDVFRSNWKLEEFVFSLVKGKPVIVSGKFGKLHHIVCLVGFSTGQNDIQNISSPDQVKLNKIKTFIIDDPWGDPNTDYVSHQGNNVELTYRQFLEEIKPLESSLKWGHLHSNIVQLLK